MHQARKSSFDDEYVPCGETAVLSGACDVTKGIPQVRSATVLCWVAPVTSQNGVPQPGVLDLPKNTNSNKADRGNQKFKFITYSAI